MPHETIPFRELQSKHTNSIKALSSTYLSENTDQQQAPIPNTLIGLNNDLFQPWECPFTKTDAHLIQHEFH